MIKHIQYGVNHIGTNNGVDTKIFPSEQWFGLDEEGKALALKEVDIYVKLNENSIREGKLARHEISMISREVGDSVVEGDLSWYDNGYTWEDNESYVAIDNNELSTEDVSTLFNRFLNHKVRITIEYLD